VNRSAAGRIGALKLHALHDPHEITSNARATANSKLDERLLAEIRAARPGITPQAEREALQKYRSFHFRQLASRPRRPRKAVNA